MPLAVIRSGRERPATIEVHVEAELGWLSFQLADELAFIVIDRLVKFAEFLGDCFIDAFKDGVGNGVVVLVDLLRFGVSRRVRFRVFCLD